ncbi:MAG: enoyl-CoA hydratase/isomerase family protein [Alphaproteobacteria bacterium]|nr:enoyl-CoA hydratase/isomerase family protein [Alphaproteobacteria bacterium]
MDTPQLPDCITLTRDHGLATVTLDRGPYGGGMNPLSAEAMEGLRDVARWLKTDIQTHCVILTGARVFSIGADLKDPDMHTHHLDTLTQRQQLLLGPDMCAAWEALEQITICAMERFALGGALALAVSCDWRVASDDCDIRLPEVPLGINMSWQANPRITVLVGPSRAKQLVILGENIGAEKAAQWGLVDVLAPAGGTLSAAQALAQKVLALPPVPVRMSKQAINAQANALSHLSSFMDREQYALLTGSDDNKAAVRAVIDKSKTK